VIPIAEKGVHLRAASGLARYLLRRLLYTALILLALSAMSFVALTLAPGDPTQVILGQTWTPERAEVARQNLGLDKPIQVRYVTWLYEAIHGDLGRSYATHERVSDMVLRAVPISLQLAVASFLISLAIGSVIGIYSAIKRRSPLDYISRVFVVSMSSMPIFWLGLIVIYIFAVKLPIFPTGGLTSPVSIVLPALTLACYSLSGIVRMMRSAMLETLPKDYIRTARSHGLSERVVIFQHALRNVLIPVVTVSGLYLGAVIGSAIITEDVFAWPGLGTLIISGVLTRDAPVVLGGVIAVAVFYSIINLLLDVLYIYLDPRIQLQLR
jgi:peptide/nickel transport system permease protein